MGIWMSRMLSYFGDREARILVLGLDNAGKTTILCACGGVEGRGGVCVGGASKASWRARAAAAALLLLALLRQHTHAFRCLLG